jgi:hypothetical protein
MIPGSSRNVEVIILREVLDSHKIKFRPAGE